MKDRDVGFWSSINGAGRTSVSLGGIFGAGVAFSKDDSAPLARLYATEAVRLRVWYRPPLDFPPPEEVGRDVDVRVIGP